MAWQSDARLAARNYRDPEERKAFRAGYSDGYHRYPKFAGSEPHYYPNAYNAGYWEGVGDERATAAERPAQ